MKFQFILNTFGLFLDFLGAILLLVYQQKSLGMVTKEVIQHSGIVFFHLAGISLLGIGFLLQIISNIFGFLG